MPKQSTDYLIELIKSLTKSEKRHFRLFVRRNQSSEEILFLQLFDFLEKYKEYDEAKVLKTIPAIKKRQLSNLKAHLYKQLLISLRLLNKNYDEEIDNRERIDFAKVLYNKGLYRQALETLDRVKKRVQEAEQLELLHLIISFEKQIEDQYITRSKDNRAEELTADSERVHAALERRNAFSNLSLQLYGLYLKVGYIRNEKDYFFVREFFQSNLPNYQYEDLDFFGKLYFNKSHVWYHFITQDFLNGYRYAQRWVDLFEENPNFKTRYPIYYLKGLHNLLNMFYNLGRYDKFTEALDLLNNFSEIGNVQQIKNLEGIYTLYKYHHGIKKHFLNGTFTEGIAANKPILKLIEDNPYNWDDRRIMVFQYRIASLYFGAGDFDTSVDYLNLIINQKTPNYREDIQCFARILNLMAHYELGNEQLVEYQVKSVYRFLAKMEDLQEVQQEIFRFVRRLTRIRRDELPHELKELKKKLLKISKKPLEQRPFLYLDVLAWIESKLTNRTVQEVIREQFLEEEA